MELMMTKLRLTAAERMRLHRKRQRQGLQYVRILLHVTDIDGGIMRDPNATPELRIRAAQVAPPFIHSKPGTTRSSDPARIGESGYQGVIPPC
jgi:hypothetical protein